MHDRAMHAAAAAVAAGDLPDYRGNFNYCWANFMDYAGGTRFCFDNYRYTFCRLFSSAS